MASTATGTDDAPTGKRLGLLTLTALGVVYGDIGTSPLYALREAFYGDFGIALTEQNVLGVLSLMIWSLVLVVTIKYLLLVMRADNDGEGGILALMELVAPKDRDGVKTARWVIPLGLFGAALLYGDGMITPAISVLSAVEGLKVATPLFQPYVVPITCGILVGLFVLQSRGTHGVGKIFGPIMIVWFIVLGVLGVRGIIADTSVLRAFSPWYGVEFFGRHGLDGAVVLGAVFLVVTGGEALYADMGHLGARPIRLGWFVLVLPGLLLNYLGQGALLINAPHTAHNPFYRLAPDWATYPMVVLATAATVIASQAIISGAFSLTLQAVQFDLVPRMDIRHTSESQFGQIYVPLVNWVLLAATIGLVIGFQSSSALAAAYGVAVSLTMIITDALILRTMLRLWKWPAVWAVAITVFFSVIDLGFFGANSLKIASGGWFPLVVAGLVYLVMSTWRLGRKVARRRLQQQLLPLSAFLEEVGVVGELETGEPRGEVEVDVELDVVRTPGAVVYLTNSTRGIPRELVVSFHHHRSVRETVVFLTVRTDPRRARLDPGEELEVTRLGGGFYRVIGHAGFMQEPDVPAILRHAEQMGLTLEPDDVSYVFGKETIVAADGSPWHNLRARLFSFLLRNARSATEYFGLPREQVMEIGTQVEV